MLVPRRVFLSLYAVLKENPTACSKQSYETQYLTKQYCKSTNFVAVS